MLWESSEIEQSSVNSYLYNTYNTRSRLNIRYPKCICVIKIIKVKEIQVSRLVHKTFYINSGSEKKSIWNVAGLGDYFFATFKYVYGLVSWLFFSDPRKSSIKSTSMIDDEDGSEKKSIWNLAGPATNFWQP